MTFAEFLTTIPADDIDIVRERAAVIELYAAAEGEVTREEAEWQAWDDWVRENVF